MTGENDSSIIVIALEIQQELPWQAELVLLLPYHFERWISWELSAVLMNWEGRAIEKWRERRGRGCVWGFCVLWWFSFEGKAIDRKSVV